MISLQHLIQDPEIYKKEMERRFKEPNLIDSILEIHSRLKPKQQELEYNRRYKNEFNDLIIKLDGQEKVSKLAEMKVVSEQTKFLENETKDLQSELEVLLYQVPNLTWEGMPVAPNSDGNVETKRYGIEPKFDFEPKNYYELPIFERDYLTKKGNEAAGFRGYYITGELAKLQYALFNWTLERLISKGFDFVIPPVAVNESVMYGTGFFPSGKDDVYEVLNGDKTQYLPGTSEAALMYLHSNETLDLDTPKKLTAWTRCFRKEIGAYGKDTKGGIRVHQFEKIETVYLCKPDQTYAVFEEMTGIFHETLDLLGLYYHDLETSTGDNSNKNHRMIDIEAWFPAQNTFREVCSSSICTDYQTRTLNIKYKNSDGSTQLAHSLNCTGITNRTLFAIMEQYQTQDGRVKIPDVLVSKFGKEWLE